MRYIQYARKSSEGDERQVQSIPDQNAVLDRMANQLGLEVAYRFEEAHSAKQPGARPVFAKVLDLIQSSKADGILCWHINRLSRNPIDSGTLSWLLQQGTLKSIRTPEREYRPEDNVVIMAVENAVANQFIIDLRKNIHRAQEEKAARGWYPRKPPTGYLTNRDTGEIEVDAARFSLLRGAWDLMLTGAYSVEEVRQKLKSWGYTTRRRGETGGKMLARSHLYKLFDNPFYFGDFYFDGQRHEGRHQPMVTREEFQRVQHQIHGDDPKIMKRHVFPFSGLIRCGGCGCMVTAERKVKHYKTTNRTVAYSYYHCTRTRACKEPAVTEAYLEGEIGSMLNRCHLNPRAAAWARRALEKDLVGDEQSALKMERDAQARMENLEAKVAGLLELRLAGEIEAGEMKRLKERFLNEREELGAKLARLRNTQDRRRETIDSLITFAEQSREAFVKGDDKVKREIAARLAERYLLTLGNLEIRPDPLIAPLLGLEPPEPPRNMVRRGKSDRIRPTLCTQVDHIRTLLKVQDLDFPRLECLQR